jgi:hypothetical protein
MKIFENKTFVTIMSLILSFVMGFGLFACSVFFSVKFTFFSPSFLTETLNNTHYYQDLCDEITDNLKDLGDASGLDKSFFEGFVDEVLVRKDVQAYIDDFYSGNKPKVNPSDFQKELRGAIEKYIGKSGIDSGSLSEDNINYFIKNASDIYVSNIEIAYFSQLQSFFVKYNSRLNIAIVITLIVVIAIALIFIFTNEWKHIALRYIYYATASAGLLSLILALTAYFSGFISKLTVLTRSLKDMYTACFNSALIVTFVISIVLLAISAFLWVMHNRLRKKAV